MAKISTGRLSGVYGMQSFTSIELFALAERLESQILDPENLDDPRWLKRWATKIHRLAIQKEKAQDQKVREAKGERSDEI